MNEFKQYGLLLLALLIVSGSIALSYYIFSYRYEMCVNYTYHTWWQCLLLLVR